MCVALSSIANRLHAAFAAASAADWLLANAVAVASMDERKIAPLSAFSRTHGPAIKMTTNTEDTVVRIASPPHRGMRIPRACQLTGVRSDCH
jgi:hypothetical protein